MNFFYCKKCLMPSTRPRSEFNDEGICNGCLHAEKKKTFDWDTRWKDLQELCGKYRGDGKQPDMIIPWSGGKDSYHIAYMAKYELGMNPLLVKVAPLIPTEIGKRNEDNIRDAGFRLIKIYPERVYVDLCLKGLIEQGRPQMGFVTGITTMLIQEAMQRNIKLIMYGEEGETEYGGRTDYSAHGFNRQWIVDVYFSGHDTNEYDLDLWHLPSQEELDKAGVCFAHWSNFAPWDNELHLHHAKKIGFEYGPEPGDGVTGIGTFTNYTSLDDPYLRTFHTYLMFLKFGFGRGSHEATGEIRSGRINRAQGIMRAVNYDDYDCSDFWDKLCNLYRVSDIELQNIVESHANRAIVRKVGYWEKLDRRWQLRPEIFGYNRFIENAVEIDYDGSY